MKAMTEGLLPQPPRQYRLALTLGDHTPGHLRRIARAHVRMWGLDAIADAVELAVSELATNVYQHTPDRWCEVTLLHTLHGVRIEVYDRSPATPAIPTAREAEDLAENGRGLALIDLFTDAWKVVHHATGKTVWCELHATPRPLEACSSA